MQLPTSLSQKISLKMAKQQLLFGFYGKSNRQTSNHKIFVLRGFNEDSEISPEKNDVLCIIINFSSNFNLSCQPVQTKIFPKNIYKTNKGLSHDKSRIWNSKKIKADNLTYLTNFILSNISS